jgi:hypothetical protein
VIRTAQDYAGDEFGDPSLRWLDRLIDLALDLGALASLAGAMPEATVALRERVAIVQERIVKRCGPSLPLRTEAMRTSPPRSTTWPSG